MRPQGGHARAAADIQHLAVAGPHAEIAVGAKRPHLVARLQAEDVGRADPRVAILPPRGQEMRILKRSLRSICGLLAIE